MTKKQLRKKQTQSFLDDLYERERKRREVQDISTERRLDRRMSKAERRHHKKALKDDPAKRDLEDYQRTLEQLGIYGRHKSIAFVIEKVEDVYPEAKRVYHHSRQNVILVEREADTLEVLLWGEKVIGAK